MPTEEAFITLRALGRVALTKRFCGFDECLEREENRTLAEDLSISSDLPLITLEVKKGRGLPKIIKLRYLLKRCADCEESEVRRAHNTVWTALDNVLKFHLRLNGVPALLRTHRGRGGIYLAGPW